MKREYSIRKTLRQLAKQRVAMVHQPGNYWVIEKAMPRTKQNEENLQTSMMRGWVEILHESVPTQNLTDSMKIKDSAKAKNQHLYRLTDAGWNAIHRTNVLVVLGLILAVISTGVAILGFKLQP
jgi:hypothetical protein